MKFSIRDLLLVTVIVALAVAWWVDRSRLTGEIRDYEIIEIPGPRGVAGPGMPLKEWRQERKEWREADERLERELNAMMEAQREQKVRTLFGGLPNSQAPAPNPPKPSTSKPIRRTPKSLQGKTFVPTLVPRRKGEDKELSPFSIPGHGIDRSPPPIP